MLLRAGSGGTDDRVIHEKHDAHSVRIGIARNDGTRANFPKAKVT